MIFLFVFLTILPTFDIYSVGNGELSDARNGLTIYTLTSDRVCTPEMMLYNFTHSVAAAVRYARSLLPVESDTYFVASLEHRCVPGCSMQEASRAGTLYEVLQNLQKIASKSAGFSVLLGPSLASDCNLVNEWINLGDPNNKPRVQLYQISYYCQIFSSSSVFIDRLADTVCDSLAPPIAAVSVAVQRKTILQGILVYLLNSGWKHIALFYDMLATDLGIPETLNSIALTIPLSRKREKVLQLLTSVSIKSTTNFTNLVKPLEDQIEG
ncbi:hypothetical protein EGR_10957 [Echinococcus granulosus]|uniref:Uncharacterized protein n=1 Tax=Echinococcus granulosus TaxID=6210 RepID=W6TZE9_ECHGR|nr:hypothetical protein EGR_10957 [Echinococcus granulosus]EUB54185.1 hypothetical protein EGR_10957 [Echinococcus granulosus]